MNTIIAESLKKSFSYLEYRNLVSESLIDAEPQFVNGFDLVAYTKLNEQRMKRLDKTLVITPENQNYLKNIKHSVLWVVLSEGWCGDAAQALPVFYKMAELSDFIDLKIVLRDDNDQLMNLFLTNGGKSIPKLLMVDPETLEVFAHWGPRPAKAVELVNNLKDKFGGLTDDVKEELQKWYNTDKSVSTQNEIISLLKNTVE